MALKYVLLTQLADAEKSGYDIVKSFDASFGHFWQATHQQVYRELAALHDKKWLRMRTLSQADRPDKKLYRTTQRGKAALIEWLEQPLEPDRVRDSLLVRLNAAAVTDATLQTAILQSARERTSHTLQIYREIEKQHFHPAPSAQSNRMNNPVNCCKRVVKILC